MILLIVTALVLLLMVGELWLSRANERALRRRGASEPAGDVYRTMAWVYPACFLAMAGEGWLNGPPARGVVLSGLAMFVAAKTLKYWAIASLGSRWTFRVLVPPDAPLVTHGPYAWMRHPNYVAVLGELVGVALIAGAVATGAASVALFAWLLRHRIATEDRALGRDQAAKRGV